ncbi:hypothetical protein ACIGO6_10435 [Streptomyces sp. NPDC053750]|uniref:hypothetical protein n=1 Tax=Streptomyces sp. NPDC053750 TaxID=3365714 RepID=UPI0037D8F746
MRHGPVTARAFAASGGRRRSTRRRRPAEGADHLHRVQAIDLRGIRAGSKHGLRHMPAHGSGAAGTPMVEVG